MNRFFTLLLAASCLTAVGQYEVGDVGPAGGWIFYVDSLDEFDWDFLEVADRAIAATREMNGDSNVSIDGQGLPAELGTGRSNSQKLVANNSAIPQFSAIIQALGCELGGYSDWFIPSFEEMHLVYENVLDLIDEDGDLGNSTADWVWTSSSVWSDVGLIDLMHLTSGNPLGVSANGTNHDFNIRVIPIRSGNIPSEEFCGFGTIWDPPSQSCVVDESACGWQPDGNGDNLIGVNDLLDLLGVYGDTDYDQDGIWDSADDCVGEYDECGVCNGSGPSIPIIESIEILYDSVYAEPIDEWLVFEVGADTNVQYVCELISGCTDPEAANFSEAANVNEGCVYYSGCNNQNSVTYNGKSYALVEINGQCWFQSNLETSSFRDGSTISYVSPDAWQDYDDYSNEISSVNYPAYSIPPCDNSCSSNGYQYNSLVWNNNNEVCPLGFRVPMRVDFEYLIEPYSDGLGELKLTGGWNGNIPSATNESGFSAVGTGSLGNSWSGNNTSWNGADSWSRIAIKQSFPTPWISEVLLLSILDTGGGNGIHSDISVTSRAIRCIKD